MGDSFERKPGVKKEATQLPANLGDVISEKRKDLVRTRLNEFSDLVERDRRGATGEDLAKNPGVFRAASEMLQQFGWLEGEDQIILSDESNPYLLQLLSFVEKNHGSLKGDYVGSNVHGDGFEKSRPKLVDSYGSAVESDIVTRGVYWLDRVQGPLKKLIDGKYGWDFVLNVAQMGSKAGSPALDRYTLLLARGEDYNIDGGLKRDVLNELGWMDSQMNFKALVLSALGPKVKSQSLEEFAVQWNDDKVVISEEEYEQGRKNAKELNEKKKEKTAQWQREVAEHIKEYMPDDIEDYGLAQQELDDIFDDRDPEALTDEEWGEASDVIDFNTKSFLDKHPEYKSAHEDAEDMFGTVEGMLANGQSFKDIYGYLEDNPAGSAIGDFWDEFQDSERNSDMPACAMGSIFSAHLGQRIKYLDERYGFAME